MGCPCGGRFFFVTASLVLTAAALLVGISFFGPYWLSNVNKVDGNEAYISNSIVEVNQKPHRGLWAQCGKDCTWFWENKYELQNEKLTKLKWHIATQVLYFIAASLILASEIFARVQMCCHGEGSTCIYVAIGSLVITSATLQTAAVATFGGGSAGNPYNAESNPTKIEDILNGNIDEVYLGWCYWMAVTGAIVSLIAGIFFILAGCCRKGRCCLYGECCDDLCERCDGCCCCCCDDERY